MPAEIPALLSRTWRIIRDVVLNPDPHDDDRISGLARSRAPMIWLLGKVQSGKTSIVHAITGHPAAEIGAGYRPCTRTARVFDFPADAPVIRFLDTRGFAEPGYDPGEDLQALEGRAHAILAVARAMDPQQQELLDVLRAVRGRRPDWAVVLAQTALHEGYAAGREHPPYAELLTTPGLEDLRRSLAAQAAAFSALPGDGPVLAVPVDLTRPEDGFTETDYGLQPLLDALVRAGVEGMLGMLREAGRRGADARADRAHPHILGYAAAAGATDMLPLAGLVAVPTIQGKLLHSIGRIYGIDWDRRTIGEFAASLGAGTAAGIGLAFGARQLAKLIPVWGQTAGAAAAGAAGFAVTYALGRAACHYLDTRRTGHVDREGVARIYRDALRDAFTLVHRKSTRH
jgi:uncharacterized protein (DUF697 family)